MTNTDSSSMPKNTVIRDLARRRSWFWIELQIDISNSYLTLAARMFMRTGEVLGKQ
jgi:hypothetical protein